MSGRQQLRLVDMGVGKPKRDAVTKHTYYLPVCEKHLIERSFTLGYRTRMPKHWRENQASCAHSNCYHDATEWLIIDLSEAVFR